MEINLTSISKETLMKMWEAANNVNTVGLTTFEKFKKFCEWLEDASNFEAPYDVLAKEISSYMTAVYVHGWNEEVYFEETDTYDVIQHTYDKDNFDIAELFNNAVEDIKTDKLLLKEYGITATKKTTKNCPYLLSEINWDCFRNENYV